jgi:hypothetical protein
MSSIPNPSDPLHQFRTEMARHRAMAGLTYTQTAAASGMTPARVRAIEQYPAPEHDTEPELTVAGTDATLHLLWIRAEPDAQPEVCVEIVHGCMADYDTVIYLPPSELQHLIGALTTMSANQPH